MRSQSDGFRQQQSLTTLLQFMKNTSSKAFCNSQKMVSLQFVIKELKNLAFNERVPFCSTKLYSKMIFTILLMPRLISLITFNIIQQNLSSISMTKLPLSIMCYWIASCLIKNACVTVFGMHLETLVAFMTVLFF